jgi:hypothetical protein
MFILLASTCFGQSKVKKSVSYGVYSRDNYYFYYPKNWSIDDSKKIVILLTELDGIGDFFQENINLLIEPLGTNPIDIYKYLDLTKVQLSKIEVRNLKSEIRYDSISKTDIGELTYSRDYNGSELLVKQVVKIRGSSAYIFTYTGSRDGYNKYLSTAVRVMSSLRFYNIFSKKPTENPLEYKDLRHKLYFTHLDGYEDFNEDKKSYFFHMVNLSDDYLRNYYLKFSEDWSFRIAGDDYAQNVTKESIKNALEVVYKDISINVFEKSFPKNLSEKVFHVIFSGVEVETGERMTVATFQMVKNHKMYTLNCGCKSSYFSSYYKDCLSLLRSLKIY